MYIYNGIQDSLEKIDSSLIRDEYKLKVFSQYLLPAIRYKLTVHEITETNLVKMDALGDRYMKKWLHLPQSGTLAVIHMPEGLNIKSFSHIYKESHAVSHASSRMKADDAVNVALTSRVARECRWTRKNSIAMYSETHYQEVTNTTELMPENTTLQYVKNKVKQNISAEFQNMWHNHIKHLLVQGRFLEILHIEKTHISWRSLIYNLPRGVLQFAVNASIDTLATNANLKRWGKRSNAKCGLCGQRETLHHVLNNCEHMLDRYLWRHNSVISYLKVLLSEQMPPDSELHVDLPGEMTGISTIPTDIMVTNQKPDLVIVNRRTKVCLILELSVPFEMNITNTHQRKVDRYKTLISDIEDNGYQVEYYPLEIGSRGYLDKDNAKRLKSFLRDASSDLRFNHVKSSLLKIVLIASYIVYHSKYEECWQNPMYICI